ncbi:hypothetical protein FIBSPDRAFT_945468 [Athelia psychrophila]|uniref:DUF6534 domain-containing protein n=1 Tax=Athelia psychrophila TaxID=1759441 RepID=A0A166TTC9_9AGAM|nr:hypothetical protein FIBSPDRAFT_945468 [Fibularhizoctonia sp. CBS 109695]
MSSLLDYSLGAYEVGVLISTFLYGVCTIQVYLYFVSARRDALKTRSLVLFVWVLDTLDTVFAWHRLYKVTVAQFGSPGTEEAPDWSLNASGILASLVAASVQSFFAWRIHILSRKWPITIALWVGSVLIVAAATATVICQSGNIIDVAENYVRLITVTQALVALVDVINTVTLCRYLRISKTGFSSTNDAINHIFLWTIQTGLVTTIAAIASLVVSVLLPKTALWLSVALFQSKLYSNSLLASLNGRAFLQGELEKDSSFTQDNHSVSVIVMSDMQSSSKPNDTERAL